MKEINNREDVYILVCRFYDKIKTHELLGPIFNTMIATDEWPAHLEKLTDFWETNLFGVRKFKGNPTLKHLHTDEKFNYAISKTHFDHWLQLWQETIDELYEGDLATRAKMAAFNIAQVQQMIVNQNKPKNSIT